MILDKSKTLMGQVVTLEPLTASHYDDLYAIAQDDETWAYTLRSATGKNFSQWFESALDKQHLAFAVRHNKSNNIVGSTRFYDINLNHKRLSIGYTWYSKDARSTAVNPECKLLLLTEAFEILNINRVEFATDLRNARSQGALKKLGAQQEGILRHHMISQNDYIRDTVVFSIIKSEWPVIKKNLLSRLLNMES